MLSRHFLVFGQPTEPPEQLRLRAGPLTCLFEPHTGFLHRISIGQLELLRGIYGAVRDRNWGTVPAKIENLEAQPATLESLRQFAPRPAVISPITLRPRFNPNATAAAAADPDQLPPEVDPRQLSVFAAAWTLGSLVRLSVAGPIHSLTWFETTGWRGLMETEAGSPLPHLFPSIPGAVFPVYHLFAHLAELRQWAPTASPAPEKLACLAGLDAQNRRHVLLANLTAGPLAVRFHSTLACAARCLDQTNAEWAMREPEQYLAAPARILKSTGGGLEFNLQPYALARLELEKGP